MRTWGRIGQIDEKGGTWVKVETDENGYSDAVYLTTIAQTFKLNLGESPFYADRGIPAAQAVISQVQPDYYVNVTQQLFAPFFAALIIAKRPNTTNPAKPTYAVSVTTKSGFVPRGPIAT